MSIVSSCWLSTLPGLVGPAPLPGFQSAMPQGRRPEGAAYASGGRELEEQVRKKWRLLLLETGVWVGWGSRGHQAQLPPGLMKKPKPGEIK